MRRRLIPARGDKESPRSRAGRRGVASFSILPTWGDEGIASFSRKKTRHRLIPAQGVPFSFLALSPRAEKEARRRRITRKRQIVRGIEKSKYLSRFSFSSSPSSSFSLNRPLTVEIIRRRSKSMVPPDSARYPIKPVLSANTGRYRLKQRTLLSCNALKIV
ncbi:hypothetical protein BHE74_00052837 [Ensete ventricosum]|nr:hypothetical protein BHE74_00052837 [Ensete ventricosum]